jgi:hypothetical protein
LGAETHDLAAGPDARNTSGLKVIAVIVGLLAVAGVTLNAIDQALAQRAGRANADKDALAVQATAFASGSALAGQFRCTEEVALKQLQYMASFRNESIARFGESVLDAAMVRITAAALANMQQISALLDRRLEPQLHLDPNAAAAASNARCTPASARHDRAEADTLVARQNAAADRAADLGQARDRIPQALALFGVAGAVFAFTQQTESRRGRRLSAGAGLVVVAVGATLGALAVSAL